VRLTVCDACGACILDAFQTAAVRARKASGTFVSDATAIVNRSESWSEGCTVGCNAGPDNGRHSKEVSRSLLEESKVPLGSNISLPFCTINCTGVNEKSWNGDGDREGDGDITIVKTISEADAHIKVCDCSLPLTGTVFPVSVTSASASSTTACATELTLSSDSSDSNDSRTPLSRASSDSSTTSSTFPVPAVNMRRVLHNTDFSRHLMQYM